MIQRGWWILVKTWIVDDLNAQTAHPPTRKRAHAQTHTEGETKEKEERKVVKYCVVGF